MRLQTAQPWEPLLVHNLSMYLISGLIQACFQFCHILCGSNKTGLTDVSEVPCPHLLQIKQN